MTPAAPPATDEARLYESVLDAPADDAPRLVYADWLDEHGQGERAEFVRVQCELANSLPPPVRADGTRVRADSLVGMLHLRKAERTALSKHIRHYESLERRERELLLANWGQWVPPHDVFPNLAITNLNQINGRGAAEVTFARGFIDRVELSLAAFLGGPCGQAHARADSVVFNSWDPPDCPDCRGTGRTPGLAAALGRLPLRADGVTLVDREPMEFHTGHWRWYPGDREPHEIPSALFVFVKTECNRGGFDHWMIPTRELADRALATACVSHARNLAGLPQLVALTRAARGA